MNTNHNPSTPTPSTHLYRRLAHLRAPHQPHDLRQYGVAADPGGAHQQRTARVEGAADQWVAGLAQDGLGFAFDVFCGLEGGVGLGLVMALGCRSCFGGCGAFSKQ